MNLGRETELVEFKKSTGEHREAMESIASMLNKHGRGTLYFGVLNNGDVVGQTVADKTLRDIAQEIAAKIRPIIHPEITRLEDGEGRAYIRVEFEGDDAPYACDGRYRIRTADSDDLMSPEEVRRFASAAYDHADPWDGRPSGESPDSVSPSVVERFVAAGVKRDRIPEPYSTDGTALASLGLIARDGSLTNAGATLFCRGGRPFRLTMGVVAGNDRAGTILDLVQEDGPVFDLIDRAEHFVMANIRRRLVFGTGVAREEVPEIPRAAVREAVVNAFCHRDWRDPSAVVIDVFTDTVSITNPGLFPEGKPPESFMAGSVAPSRPRNPLLASALYKGGLIETYGSGIRRIKSLCEEAGVRFGYRQDCGCTTIVFHRPGSQLVGEAADVELDGRKRILALLSDGETRTSGAISEALGMSRRSTQRVLGLLEADGAVERVGGGRGTKWRRGDS